MPAMLSDCIAEWSCAMLSLSVVLLVLLLLLQAATAIRLKAIKSFDACFMMIEGEVKNEIEVKSVINKRRGLKFYHDNSSFRT